MHDVIIRKYHGEVYIHIDADRSIIRELSDAFTFFAGNYMFHPKYRAKIWDGKIRLLNNRTNTIYRGLLPLVLEEAKRLGYSCSVEFDDSKNDMSLDEFSMFIKSFSVCAQKREIKPRDYQLSAIYHAITNKRSLLLSPTSSGKSLIIYIILKWFFTKYPNEKVILIVPKTSLVEQMYTDFEDYNFQEKNVDFMSSIHRIYSGKEKNNPNARIIITTWQSVYKLPKKWFEQYRMVIGDEAHEHKAKSLTDIADKLVNADYRIGTTGTLDNIDCHKLTLEGVFGPVHRVITTKELMDSDTIAQLSIKMLTLKYPDVDRKVKRDYQTEIDFLVNNEKRNRFINNLALSLDGNTLILYNLVEKHGIPLFEALSAKASKDRKCFFISGAVPVDDRESIRKIVETESNAIIVASMGCFSTGVNIRNLHSIIFAAPSKSQIRVLQSIGRGLRKSDRDTRLYDIVDDLSTGSRKNYTLKHGIERLKIYNNEKFDYKIHTIDI